MPKEHKCKDNTTCEIVNNYGDWELIYEFESEEYSIQCAKIDIIYCPFCGVKL